MSAQKMTINVSKNLLAYKSFTGAVIKVCVTLGRLNFVRKKPVIIQISYVKNRTRKLKTSFYQTKRGAAKL